MKKTLLILSAALLLSGCANNRIKVKLSNYSEADFKSGTIEISVSEISSRINNVSLKEVIVKDDSGSEIPSQLIYNGYSEPQSLIFQADVPAKSNRVYKIKKGIPRKYENKVFGRFVPERMDDYAWENDRIAYRIYGTALIQKDGPSNGLDVWVKRTDRLVVDKWYSEYLAGKNSYHDDNGEGCDCYKVGRTLGAGAMAPYVNDSLWLGINFESYETLDNGPIRTSFRLKYPPFAVNGTVITETRTFSLDAGSQMNLVKEKYEGSDVPFNASAGIVKRPEGNILSQKAGNGYIAYSLNAGENGTIYIGTVIPSGEVTINETAGHLLINRVYTPGEELVYYTGAGWSKWGFEKDADWIKYLDQFMFRLRNPLIVTLK